tara:strand:+ start:2188 stop:3330 length:1143 start_codon:yes stop_codon:yes gene_type:complete
MATFTKIAKPSAHHDEVLYSGSDSNQTITGLGFQPDWLHIKNRNENGNHNIIDTVRGIDKIVYVNSTDGQDTESKVSAITSDGFTLVGNKPNTNDADDGFIAHCFKLAGSTTTNDASATGVGTIDSSYRANTDSGISVVTWTGTGANGTIAHGLGRAPDCIIMKDISQDGYHWEFYMHSGNAGGSPENSASSDEDHHIRFFDNDGTADPDDDHTYFNDTKPTSTVFSIGTANNVNQSGISQMAICIANTNGSVRAGAYQGNGKTHGSYVFTGFRPRAIWVSGRLTEDPHWKTVTTRFTSATNAAASSGGANHGNPIGHNLKTGDASAKAEVNQCNLDIFSNGFSPASTDGKHNGGGYYYYYIAWAGAPMVGTNKVLGTAF